MVTAVEGRTIPVHYNPGIHEAFLRWTMFEGLVGLLCSFGTLALGYLAITDGSVGASLLLMPILLTIVLACSIDVRRRMLDFHEGPRYSLALVTDKRPDRLLRLGGLLVYEGPSPQGGEIEFEMKTGRQAQRLRVSNEDLARINVGDHLHFLRYPHTGVSAALDCFDAEAQAFIPLPGRSPESRIASIGSQFDGSNSNLGLIGALLILLLLPLWLIAYLVGRITVGRHRRHDPLPPFGRPPDF
jgi:hypothetical protein